jgi:hypothetical protein
VPIPSVGCGDFSRFAALAAEYPGGVVPQWIHQSGVSGVIDPAMRKISDERILLATSGPPTPVEVNRG